jgi:hypothetical protein
MKIVFQRDHLSRHRLAAHQVVAHLRGLRENVRLQRRLQQLLLFQGLLPALGLGQSPRGRSHVLQLRVHRQGLALPRRDHGQRARIQARSELVKFRTKRDHYNISVYE